MKKRIGIEVDVPEGWESAGALRDPLAGEHYLSADGTVAGPSGGGLGEPRLILRRVEPKRETRWMNVFHGGLTSNMWASRSSVDCVNTLKRIGVVRAEFEDDKLVAVSLEPIPEGEGLSAAEAGR